jgi:hypothetical protein
MQSTPFDDSFSRDEIAIMVARLTLKIFSLQLFDIKSLFNKCISTLYFIESNHILTTNLTEYLQLEQKSKNINFTLSNFFFRYSIY